MLGCLEMYLRRQNTIWARAWLFYLQQLLCNTNVGAGGSPRYAWDLVTFARDRNISMPVDTYLYLYTFFNKESHAILKKQYPLENYGRFSEHGKIVNPFYIQYKSGKSTGSEILKIFQTMCCVVYIQFRKANSKKLERYSSRIGLHSLIYITQRSVFKFVV